MRKEFIVWSVCVTSSFFCLCEGEFAFGEFAGADFFEEVDQDFGFLEVWVWFEAGFNDAQFEELICDAREVGGGKGGLGGGGRDLFAGGELVAFGFVGL